MADPRGPEMGCASLSGERVGEVDEGGLETVGDEWGEVVDRVNGDDRDD